MMTRRSSYLMAAASGLFVAAVAVTPMVVDQRPSLQAVPAAPAAAVIEAPPLQTPSPEPSSRDEQVTRDLERPVLDDVAAERTAFQAQVSDAISTEQERLSAEEKAAQEKRQAEERAKEEAAKAAQAKKAAEGASSGSSSSGSYSGAPKEIARQMAAAEFGWGEGEFQCYNNIIMRESEWRTTATNPSSGAYGIPQALPASKMASAGSDWRTNPETQIRWGLGYVEERYGTPCAAWSFKQAKGWY